MSEKLILPEKVRGRSLFLDDMLSLVGVPFYKVWQTVSTIAKPSDYPDMLSILNNWNSENGEFLEKKCGVFFFLGEGCGDVFGKAPHIHTDIGNGKGRWSHKHRLESWREGDYGVFSAPE